MREPADAERSPVIDLQPLATTPPLVRDRRAFLRWSAVVGAGGSLALALSERLATARAGGDAGALNLALTLEHLEAELVRAGLNRGLLSGRAADLVTAIAGHEQVHVALVSEAVDRLGAAPAEPLPLRLPHAALARPRPFLAVVSSLQDLTAAAYQGQLTRLRSPALLALVTAIAGAESRHAAVLRRLTGADPFPDPLEPALARPQVRRAVEAFTAG